MSGSDRRAHAQMFVASLLISTSFPVVEIVAPSLEPRLLTLMRFGEATLLFAPWIAWRYRRAALVGLRALARYALLSAALVAFFWAMFAALRSTTAINSGALFTCGPLFAAGFSALLLRQRPSRRRVVALLVGMIGALWVVFRGDARAALAMRFASGDAIFLAGTAALGLYATLIKRLHRGEPMPLMTFWTLASGTLWLTLLSLPSLDLRALAAMPARTAAWVSYLALFTTLITFYLTQVAATRIGPAPTLAYTYLNPTLVLLLELAWPARARGAPRRARSALTASMLPGVLLSALALLLLLTERSARADRSPARDSGDDRAG